MKARVDVLETAEVDRWREILQRCVAYDVYHLPEYHLLAEEREKVRATLFVHEAASVLTAMPLLLRRIDDVEGVHAPGWWDATSVYGYVGPVSSSEHPSEVAESFGRYLRDYLESERVVSAFSRLHPILGQESFRGTSGGQIVEVGPTVAIDLSSSLTTQRKQYVKGHRYDIRRAEREGVTCFHDREWVHFEAFVDIYHATMRRAGAAGGYFFGQAYFARLRELLGSHLQLFVALKDGVVLSGALFTICNSILQYHLAGTDSRFLELAPSKLIIDAVRIWGAEMGARIFHLGGGVGSREDSLFRFKAGFSDLRYRFRVWQMIVDEERYRDLVAQKRTWTESQGSEAADADYFPSYRCPTRRSVAETT